jgi:hypothetical protein
MVNYEQGFAQVAPTITLTIIPAMLSKRHNNFY